jgi:hypothetical protein
MLMLLTGAVAVACTVWLGHSVRNISSSLRVWLNSGDYIRADDDAQERVFVTEWTLHVSLTVDRSSLWSATVLWLHSLSPWIAVANLQVSHVPDVTEVAVDLGVYVHAAARASQRSLQCVVNCHTREAAQHLCHRRNRRDIDLHEGDDNFAFHSWQEGFSSELERILKMANPALQKNPATRLIVNPKARLFDQIREVLRFHHYAIRTEKAYTQWIKRFLMFHRQKDRTGPEHGWRHPKDMGAPEVAAFLTHLATNRDVAASTQNQALNALVFLYEHVLEMPLGDFSNFARVTRPARLPQVLTQDETRRLLAALKPGTTALMIRLLYGTGMRIMECLRLRVHPVR